MDGPRNTLLWSGWFNQGFQPVLGVAAATAKLMGLDVNQIRMAFGNAASAMARGPQEPRQRHEVLHRGNAAMHGVMAAELAGLGFTANEDILDGDDGVARLLGREVGDPEKVLDGLGSWDMATRGSTMRLHASCGAGHWGQDALQQLLRRRPTDPDEIESIEVRLPAFLMPMLPYHQPRTGLEAKYSIEYDLAAIALDGRAGLHQYSDEAVNRPAAQELLTRVRYVPVEGDLREIKLESQVVLTLKDGTQAGRFGAPVPRQSAGSPDRGRGRRASSTSARRAWCPSAARSPSSTSATASTLWPACASWATPWVRPRCSERAARHLRAGPVRSTRSATF